MKTLIVIRHAKAEDSFGKDSERKLTDKGHNIAQKMATFLYEKGYRIDKIFSSTSIRTVQTTAHFAEVFHIQPNNIKYFEGLYLADVLGITESVNWLKENINTLAIIGHNPGVTNFVNDLCGTLLGAIPTCGIAVMEIETDNWEDFDQSKKKLAAYFSPKDLN